ncbi:RING-H2 finger protein ATL80-like [Salvia splendens]|uniref:RING-H2 finger protein ATL80-like n=1 Tax=Salvia splendens TaxID=180675 RepID=UPI001C2532B2|nr:RING-H2 finger protein ATL80-like [Salvia splendens]
MPSFSTHLLLWMSLAHDQDFGCKVGIFSCQNVAMSMSAPPLFLLLLVVGKHNQHKVSITTYVTPLSSFSLYILVLAVDIFPPSSISSLAIYLLKCFYNQLTTMAVSDQFVLCKAALIFAVTRWLLSLALNLLTKSIASPQPSSSCCSASSSPAANLRLLKGSLSLTTYGEMEQRLPEGHDESCAVCLNGLKKSSHVWELSNCCHVFHKHCLERWLAYDNRLTCPLCRASLIDTRPLSPASLPEQPSWAVERMLYLFGDDLLP